MLTSPRLRAAIMIHGGGHVLLSRRDFGHAQIQHLLRAGFLALSIDYRLCPETPLVDGALPDVRDALHWTRTVLPRARRARPALALAPAVVVAGWSTGGTLAMSLAWTAPTPPAAILALYCPTDYEDPFWTTPNIPRASAAAHRAAAPYDLAAGLAPRPIANYPLSAATPRTDGWLAPTDSRSRIPLHMNWHGQTLHFLLHGAAAVRAQSAGRDVAALGLDATAVRAISPLAHVRAGAYRTPTYIIHGTRDDLVPWTQSQRTVAALQAGGVPVELALVEGAEHLFDVFAARRTPGAREIVEQGVRFLRRWADEGRGGDE